MKRDYSRTARLVTKILASDVEAMARPTTNMHKVRIGDDPKEYYVWSNNYGAKSTRLIPEEDWHGDLSEIQNNMDTLTIMAPTKDLVRVDTGTPVETPVQRQPASLIPSKRGPVEATIRNKEQWIKAHLAKQPELEAARLMQVDKFHINKSPQSYAGFAGKTLRVYPAGEMMTNNNSFLVAPADIVPDAHGVSIAELAKGGEPQQRGQKALEKDLGLAAPTPQAPAQGQDANAVFQQALAELKKRIEANGLSMDDLDKEDILSFMGHSPTSSKKKAGPTNQPLTYEELYQMLGLEAPAK